MPAITDAPPEGAVAGAPSGVGHAPRDDQPGDTQDLLDRLMAVTGELILVRNQFLELLTTSADSALRSAAHRLDLLTGELQDELMAARLQPVGAPWGALAKVVKDLAGGRGARAQLQIEGRRTKVEARLVKALAAPVEQLVRRAVAGIEDPDTRKVAGKHPTGRVLLRANDNGGHVVVQVVDDGDGVGYDVESVREAVVSLGGVLEVRTELGQGTTARLSIPLELTIVPSIVVSITGNRFAIPQNVVVELLRLDDGVDGVEYVHDVPVHRLRGDLLPLVDLGAHFGGEATLQAGTDANIVVVGSEGIRFGVVVGGIHDSADLVVRPLGSHLDHIDAFCGATVLADGQVALVLDVGGIAKRSGVVHEIAPAARSTTTGEEYIHTFAETQTLLVVRVGADHRVGISISLVDRLDFIAPDSLETTGGDLVVQRDGAILRLLDLADALAYDRRPSSGEPPVDRLAVVCGRGDDRVGLLVDGVVDIVSEELSVDRQTRRGAITGSAVVAGHVTDLVNVAQLLKAAKARASA